MRQVFVVLLLNFLLSPYLFAAEYKGNPSNYQSLIGRLKPGDILKLEAGEYTNRMPLNKVTGKKGSPIIIEGIPGKTILFGKGGQNTVDIINCSYLIIRGLKIDGKGLDVDGFNFGKRGYCHDVTLEGNELINIGSNQQVVAISSKVPVWNITIRNNIIDGAGTGLYLGNSDGSQPFVNGIIEGNLVMNTIGYNMEIKHQNSRPSIDGMPASGKTIIRHNVFSKHLKGKGRSDGARPNVLVGTFPSSGSGSDDVYYVYGNFFYENSSSEYLFQGEGNVFFYKNVLINSQGGGANFMRHNGQVKKIRVFFNTIMSKGRPVYISGGASGYQQIASGNAFFADRAPSLPAGKDNIRQSWKAAGKYLKAPFKDLGQKSFFPLPGKLKGSPVDISALEDAPDIALDFNRFDHDTKYRGAYDEKGIQGAWMLSLKRKAQRSLFEILAGDDNVLKGLVRQLSLKKNFNGILKKLEKLSKTNEGAMAIKLAVLKQGKDQLEKAEALLSSDQEKAFVIYEDVIKKWKGHSIEKEASAKVKPIKKKVIAKRRERKRRLKKVERLFRAIERRVKSLRAYKGKRDFSSAEFRKLNKIVIKRILKYSDDLIKKYGDTPFAEKTKNIRKDFE